MGAPRIGTQLGPHGIKSYLNLLAAWVDKQLASSGGSVTVNRTFFVDAVYGNNTTAIPNRLDKPYLTIQAAVDAADEGDIVSIAPGVYEETVVLNPLQGVILQGAGDKTVISTPEQYAISWSPSADSTMVIRDLHLGMAGILIAPTIATLGSRSNIAIENVTTDGAILFTRVVSANVREVQRASIVAEQSHVVVERCTLTDVSADWSMAAPQPTTEDVTVVLDHCVVNNDVTVDGIATVTASNCRLSGRNTVNAVDALFNPETRLFTHLVAKDCVMGEVNVFAAYTLDADIQAVLPVLANNCTIDSVFVDATDSLPVDNAMMANVDMCTIHGEISAGERVDISAMNSTYGSLVALGAGATQGRINRSFDWLISDVGTAGGAASDIAFQVPFTDATYHVTFEFGTADQNAYVAPMSKSGAGFSAGGTTAGVAGMLSGVIIGLHRPTGTAGGGEE